MVLKITKGVRSASSWRTACVACNPIKFIFLSCPTAGHQLPGYWENLTGPSGGEKAVIPDAPSPGGCWLCFVLSWPPRSTSLNFLFWQSCHFSKPAPLPTVIPDGNETCFMLHSMVFQRKSHIADGSDYRASS